MADTLKAPGPRRRAKLRAGARKRSEPSHSHRVSKDGGIHDLSEGSEPRSGLLASVLLTATEKCDCGSGENGLQEALFVDLAV